MARGGENMLGVGGARRNLGRKALRGGAQDGRFGGGVDRQAQKRELLRKLQEERTSKASKANKANEEGRTSDESS
ncbi:DUF6243 family protein [Streptomyces sp. NL15-2K]|uniref:DUF6243 family protein n=1 Tax=Streptomyces sp. NL15-2K TaxID=376149 RepID=UPI000FFA1F92|nr:MULTISPECIES: DUF6243 family protein [Actinomycetes]WKX08539.1 DUF6243 family protein [Kutzneria buriramensis]GCB49964.1 hypothetical protein SNL152K_7307 [Streptomyces sp. NL15-2K]